MKILHVSENFGTGGAQRVALSIAAGFPGSAIASFDRKFDVAFPEILAQHGILHHFIDTEADIDRLMKNFDICHLHCWQGEFYRRLQWDKLSAKPYQVVLTLHETKQFPFDLPHIVCVSERQQNIQRNPNNAIIPNGFDLAKFIYTSRKYCNKGPLKIGFASRLDEKLEIPAAALIKSALQLVTQPYEIVVIGFGVYEEHYKRTFRAVGLPARFLGLRWDMEVALRDLDIFLYPTRDDTLPTIIMEAMVSGLPVVAPPIGAIPEMLNSNRGFCVSWEEMPSVLKNLTDSPELRRTVGEFARAFALDAYSHKRMLDKYRDLYTAILPQIPAVVVPPKLSVVVPTYKRPQLCYKTVQSLLAQDYSNLEIIVVNDGDHESDYFEVKKLPVQYIEYEKNKGLSGARNAGAERASGEYLAFVDDDDTWLPFFGRCLVEAAVRETVDVVYGAGYATARGERFNIRHCYPFDPAKLLKVNYITPSAIVIRASTFNAVGGFDVAMHQGGLHGPEDWELWLRLVQLGYSIVRCPVVGLVYGTDAQDRLTQLAFDTGAMQKGYEYINQKLGIKVG